MPRIRGRNGSNSISGSSMECGGYCWIVENFIERISDGNPIRSELFDAMDEKWRIVIQRNKEMDCLSVFVEIKHRLLEKLPTATWSISAGVTFTLLHSSDILSNKIIDTHHVFDKDEIDWGYTNFMSFSQINDYLKNGTFKITVSIFPHREFISEDDHSKEETGMVGLKNQGATCYMNSLLQTLYHLGAFRQAVYSMPTENDLASGKNTIPLALQRVFYRLQFGNKSVSTTELTKSFGWNVEDGFTQHDVQELNRVLCENLEEKMKNTCSEGTIAKLFKGTSESYISCTDIDFTSSRKEEFYDISLNVRDCKDIYESFNQYTEEELMEGENKYMAEGRGLQNAKKGIRFISFPSVLFLQLKRFEYDYDRDVMAKINDYFEFPEELNLSKYKFTDSMSDENEDTYRLYSVLVHNGDVHHGHYYSYQKPSTNDSWYKFDDEYVNEVESDIAIKKNYGGEKSSSGVTVSRANAYLLVYIKESLINDILLSEEDIKVPRHLKKKFEEEHEEEELAKERRREAKQYTDIEVVTATSLKRYNQTPDFDLFDFGLDPPLHTGFRVKKDTTIDQLKLIFEEYFNIPSINQRIWKWSERENDTYRIYRPMTNGAANVRVCSKNKKVWCLYLEEIPSYNIENPNTLNQKKNPVIFIKYYDRILEKVEFVKPLIFDCQSTYSNIVKIIKSEIIGNTMDTGIRLYEERTPNLLIPLQQRKPLLDLDIGSGDILVFELKLKDSPYLNAEEYYEYFSNRIEVEIKPYPTVDDKKKNRTSIKCELSKNMKYQQMEAKIAEELNCKPELLRFTLPSGDRPSTRPIRKTTNTNSVDEILTTNDQFRITSIYYEVLDMPLAELETKHLVLIRWQNAKTEITDTLKFLVPKTETFEYLLKELPERVNLVHNKGIRLFEVTGSKITRIIQPSTSVRTVYSGNIVAEEILTEETNKETEDKIINVLHGWSGTSGNQPLKFFGNPFRCLSKKDEPLSSMIERIRQRLHLSVEEMKEWKYAITAYKDKTYLDEDDCLSDHVFHSHTYFVLVHRNTAVRSSLKIYKDKPIKIYN